MAIGGNHLIHAARRNLDIMALIINNQNYGMTGGQYSPTTPVGSRASTALYGQIEPTFDVGVLCEASGAAFVARSTVYHVDQMEKLMLQAMTHPGFSVLEVLSPCYTNFGRQNRLGSHIEMMKDLKTSSIPFSRWEKMTESERGDYFATGVLVDRDRPRYLDSYRRVCETAARMKAEGKV